MLFASAAAVAIALSPRYLRSHLTERGEYYALIMLAVTGMMLMGASGDLVMVFLGIEVMSVCVYVLVGFFRSSGRSAEGAMKYFFLGAFASAVFLYGVALIYGITGSTKLTAISQAIQASMISGDSVLVRAATTGDLTTQGLDPLLLIGMVLILAGMAFKIALVPFHMWTPDAYEGAPSSSVGFMATAVKAAGFGALIRILFIGFGPAATRIYAFGWVQILYYLAIITIIVGNLVAISQTSVKRMLAYSSIAHAGYALIGVVASGYLDGSAGNALCPFLFADLHLRDPWRFRHPHLPEPPRT
jgi:NADH-quinone oxidoreductase subunit N